MKRILLSVWFMVLASAALAQSPVQTQPLNVTTQNGSGSITATNTFQSVFAAISGTQARRTSCTVQNNGTNKMFVFFGTLATATTPTSVQLGPAQSVNCTAGGVVLKDQVSITGTTGDQFFAAQQ